jgi:hypothetical protein
MAQIVVYMDEEEKNFLELMSEYTLMNSSSKFCKIASLKKAQELADTQEYRDFLERRKNKPQISEEEEEE